MTASSDNTDNSMGKAFKSLLQVLLSDSVPVITVNDLKQIQEEIILLDAREPGEYNVSRIPGAIHVGYNDFDNDKIYPIKKEERIIIYCSVGYRSEKIGERLQELGYTNVQNLYGGIFAWINQHQQVINDNGKTNEIHPYSLLWSTFITNKTTVKRYNPAK